MMRVAHIRGVTLMFVLAIVLGAAADPGASTLRTGDNVRITNLHQIEDDLYVFAQEITVDGFVDGDLCAFGSNVELNGQLTQTLNVFSQKMRHTGTIGGNLRAFAYTLVVEGAVGRSLMVFAYDAHIGRGAVIERDANLYGFSTRIDGKVLRDLSIEGEQVVITGEIGGDVDLNAENISILPPAVINGTLSYNSNVREITIDTVGGVSILGEIREVVPETAEGEEEAEEPSGLTLKSVVFPLAKVLAAFFFGVIVVALFSRYAEVSFQQLKSRLPTAFAAGILLVVILVVAVIVLFTALVMTVVGLILVSGKLAAVGALILVLSILAVPITAFTSVTGAVMLYAGKIVVAFVLGYLLARLFKSHPKVLGTWQLLFGLIVLGVVFLIPYLGILIYLLVSITGAGAIVLAIRRCRPVATALTETSAPVSGPPTA